MGEQWRKTRGVTCRHRLHHRRMRENMSFRILGIGSNRRVGADSISSPTSSDSPPLFVNSAGKMLLTALKTFPKVSLSIPITGTNSHFHFIFYFYFKLGIKLRLFFFPINEIKPIYINQKEQKSNLIK